MKIILVFICIFYINYKVFAQLVLTQSQYPIIEYGADSLKITTYNSLFPSFSPMANGIWDLSNLSDSLPIFYNFKVPSFGYEYGDSSLFNISGFNYQGNELTNINASGIINYGMQVEHMGYNLYAYTAGLTDSFIIDNQNILYTSLRFQLTFPCTYHNSWQSVYSYDLHYHFTVIGQGLIDTPGIIRKYITEKDTVIGWGKMRVTDNSGMPTSYFDVLQVKTTIYEKDSFFLNNLPAPPIVFLALGNYQGKSDTNYQQNFYRKGESISLAKVTFADNTAIHPIKAVTHLERLVNKVPTIDIAPEIKIYPNPVLENHFTIVLPKNNSDLYYKLNAIYGQIIEEGMLKSGNNDIFLNQSYRSGLYYLNIYNKNELIINRAITILSH